MLVQTKVVIQNILNFLFQNNLKSTFLFASILFTTADVQLINVRYVNHEMEFWKKANSFT